MAVLDGLLTDQPGRGSAGWVGGGGGGGGEKGEEVQLAEVREVGRGQAGLVEAYVNIGAQGCENS